jgi:hypothetical protein
MTLARFIDGWIVAVKMTIFIVALPVIVPALLGIYIYGMIRHGKAP